jgi:hypothetical protein
MDNQETVVTLGTHDTGRGQTKQEKKIYIHSLFREISPFSTASHFFPI